MPTHASKGTACWQWDADYTTTVDRELQKQGFELL